MSSLEGENEIPHIPKLDYLAKMRFLPYGLNLSENLSEVFFRSLKPLKTRSNFDLQRPTIYQSNGNLIRIKMHFTDLKSVH